MLALFFIARTLLALLGVALLTARARAVTDDLPLFGIDALEADQTCHRNGRPWACGEASTRQLVSLVGS